MFDRSRAEHAAKATRSLRISNGKRLPPAKTSIFTVFHRKSILSAFLALIFVSFFGTLGLSASMFPQSYDWRYSVISHLLSPRDNPSHYRLAAAGLALTGVLMLPFAGYLRQELRMIAPKAAPICAISFLAGIIMLVCACFVVPQHTHDVLRIGRLHELLGRSAAGFLALTMICGCCCAWKGRSKSRSASRLFWIWSALTLLPLAGIFSSEALLILTRVEPTRMQPVRAALRHSIFWHLGFWEWTGAVAVFAFLCAAVFLLPAQASVKALKR
jgi:vacuolar-type H+-ATPase subunit I/STV1